MQAQYLRIYALAWAALNRETDKQAVAEIRRYLDSFLKGADGAFQVSQDADVKPGEHSDRYFALGDTQRRKQGLPRVDAHLYTQQNGQTIEALATWSDTAATATPFKALRAAQWVLANRPLSGGGFSHGAHDSAGPYPGDTLAMGRAFLALYRATAVVPGLERASVAASFIATSLPPEIGIRQRKVIRTSERTQLDENIWLARFATCRATPASPATARWRIGHALSPTAHRCRRSLNRHPAGRRRTARGSASPDGDGCSRSGGKSTFSTLQHLPPWYKRRMVGQGRRRCPTRT